MTRVAACPAEAGRPLVVDTHAPVSRNGERATPVVRDGRIAGRREVPTDRRLQTLVYAGVALPRLIDRLVEVVGRAAAADRDPAVGRALRIEEEVVLVPDGQPVTPAELPPGRLRQRLGRDHQAVEGEVAALLSRQLGGVRLRGAKDVVRGQCALAAPHPPRDDLQRFGPLEDDHAGAFACLGHSPRQPRPGRSWRSGESRGRAGSRGRTRVARARSPRAPARRPRRGRSFGPHRSRCGRARPEAPSWRGRRCPPSRSRSRSSLLAPRGRSRPPSRRSPAPPAGPPRARAARHRRSGCQRSWPTPSRRSCPTARSRQSPVRRRRLGRRAGLASRSTRSTAQ